MAQVFALLVADCFGIKPSRILSEHRTVFAAQSARMKQINVAFLHSSYVAQRRANGTYPSHLEAISLPVRATPTPTKAHP